MIVLSWSQFKHTLEHLLLLFLASHMDSSAAAAATAIDVPKFVTVVTLRDLLRRCWCCCKSDIPKCVTVVTFNHFQQQQQQQQQHMFQRVYLSSLFAICFAVAGAAVNRMFQSV